ncbi:MAG TPA: DNRLRE domain-containing protein [Actinomycetota bacterium]|nr:DNRLRE domain-containing protein [Actinomycetota bacterium]
MAFPRRPRWLVGALLVTVASALVAPSAGAATLAFAPVADAYVAGFAPDSNFGSAAILRVRDPSQNSYLRFDVAGIPTGETVSSAKLRLFSSTGDTCPTAGAGTDAYRAASDSWTETGITFNNAPGKTGGILGSADGFAANTFVELDVTGAVAGNGTVDLYLEMPACTTDSVPTRFNSDEASSNRPQLVVTTAGTTPPQCSDGLDNDGDGVTDFPDDPGCTDAQDDDETDPAAAVTIKAAGDIACTPGASVTPNVCQHAATANLLGGAAQVLAIGDTQYNRGALSEYQGSYDPTWGAFKSVTKPAVGDEEYETPNAQGYRDYFGAAADPDGDGNLYYSYNVGDWHMVVLDSNCEDLPPAPGTSNGCAEDSPQEDWLEQDLESNNSLCTLAYWHKPYASSTNQYAKVRALFTTLFDNDAEIVLGGHAHNYERFRAQTPGRIANADGVVQFVVGTGGKSHRAFGSTVRANSEFRNSTKFGVLELNLHPSSYDWAFRATDGTTLDPGSATCH